jgi:hypothetical protein
VVVTSGERRFAYFDLTGRDLELRRRRGRERRQRGLPPALAGLTLRRWRAPSAGPNRHASGTSRLRHDQRRRSRRLHLADPVAETQCKRPFLYLARGRFSSARAVARADTVARAPAGRRGPAAPRHRGSMTACGGASSRRPGPASENAPAPLARSAASPRAFTSCLASDRRFHADVQRRFAPAGGGEQSILRKRWPHELNG